ncbi:hypothetical protein QN277_025038 [Acacia crassicarpa]|uniref:Uncharacterized protein n=1 Tax=Acacia crassicarpa TaxID=499986 RepID=A0AAE1JDH6_9FABA|nr:hypothetical protein QN277_025038 [Acacia crassicarpa]
MAYRRRQGISRSSTFTEEFHPSPDDPVLHSSHNLNPSYSFSPSSSLAAQAIKASSANRRDPAPSFAYNDSAFASDHLRSKGFDFNEDASGRDHSKSGFWGTLAQKAKSILDEDNFNSPNEMHDRLRSQSFHTSNGAQFNFRQSNQSPEGLLKMDNPRLRAGLDAITSSLNQLGDTFEKAFEEGRTIVETKTADLRTQIRRKGSSPGHPNQASGVTSSAFKQPPQAENLADHETQLKASRDVAMATAAKAKLLLRELKTVKADLAFAKARCSQLEEENKLLRDREGREKGHDGADDELIREQLETLLAEKARLANENETYARENRFLREIVEYHQLTMQDVVYVDEGMEEVTEVYPINGDGIPRVLSLSSLSSLAEEESEPEAKEVAPVHPEKMNTGTSGAASEAPPKHFSI